MKLNEDKQTPAQMQTQETFRFKWNKRETYESQTVQNEYRRWLFEKYFDSDPSRLDELFLPVGETKTILDAGCGAGVSALLFFGDHLIRHHYIGVDISESTIVAEKCFVEKGYSGTFLQCDLNSIPERLGLFDIILSEGVLHHTDSVEKGLASLAKRLKHGGKFLFYVYAKKAPIREFSDDHIRAALASMNDDEAWKALEPLTKLGKILGDLNIEISVDQEIPYLGIAKGRYDLQRLFYYKICKAYYHPDYTLDEMNHINFDWFRPANCFRHTPEEVRSFCARAGLQVLRLNVQESGIAVIATK